MTFANRMAAGLSAALLVIALPVAHAAAPADKTERKEVAKEVTEAAEAIRDYSAERRDEALAKAGAALEDLDARIERLKTRLDAKWGRMDQAARSEARESLKALERRRNDVAEWYGGLKHSSANAWEEVKKGFSKSFGELRSAFDKAQKSF